jgi:hypothetical protein
VADLIKPQARWKEDQIHRKIQRWLSGQFLEELIRYQVESRKGQWRVQFDYSAQQDVESVFRGLKDGDWLGWGPMYQGADRKIGIQAFYCMLGISLLQYIHKPPQAAWNGISIEQLLDELRQIQPFVLLYPAQGEKGPHRAAHVLSKQTLPQQALAKTLGLDPLPITPRGEYQSAAATPCEKTPSPLYLPGWE